MEREFQIHRTEADYSLAEFWKWTLALAIGVIMGVLGFVVDWGIEKLNNFKYSTTVASIKSTGKFSRHSFSLHSSSRMTESRKCSPLYRKLNLPPAQKNNQNTAEIVVTALYKSTNGVIDRNFVVTNQSWPEFD